VTTIVVTHDQQEAMEVADQIVVVNDGRIEQVGSPAEVYEKPQTDFVMEFVGPVTRVGDNVVRPHDLEILQDAAPGALEAIVQRVVRLGFEVRAELLPADGPQFSVQLTRAEADELELGEGDIVWVRADRVEVSAPA
jgi:sulfate transport system ATP-binding protein